MKRNELLHKEYLRFCKDTSDAAYEKAINEIMAEQFWEDFYKRLQAIPTIIVLITEARIQQALSPYSGTI